MSTVTAAVVAPIDLDRGLHGAGGGHVTDVFVETSESRSVNDSGGGGGGVIATTTPTKPSPPPPPSPLPATTSEKKQQRSNHHKYVYPSSNGSLNYNHYLNYLKSIGL